MSVGMTGRHMTGHHWRTGTVSKYNNNIILFIVFLWRIISSHLICSTVTIFMQYFDNSQHPQ